MATTSGRRVHVAAGDGIAANTASIGNRVGDTLVTTSATPSACPRCGNRVLLLHDVPGPELWCLPCGWLEPPRVEPATYEGKNRGWGRAWR